MIIILLTGFIIRLIGISHGLPLVSYGDEGRYIYYGLNIGGGFFNPHFFPAFFFYLLFIADMISIAGGFVFKVFTSVDQVWNSFVTDHTYFYVTGRAVSLFFGTLTLALIHRTAKKVFGSLPALLSMAFLAVVYIHVQYSQIAYIDVTLTFFILLGFYFVWQAFETDKLRYFVLAGLVSGLAISVKYNGLPVVMWGPVAACLMAHRDKKSWFRALWEKRSIYFCLFVVIGFTVGTPFWIFDFKSFASEFFTIVGVYRKSGVGQLGYEGSWNRIYYLMQPMRYGLGCALEILGFAGLVLCLLKRRHNLILFALFPLLYFFSIGCSDIRTPRYIMPLVPFFCMAAAYLIQEMTAKFKSNKLRSGWIAIAALSIIIPNLARDIRYIQIKKPLDTREQAFEWAKGFFSGEDHILRSYYTAFEDGEAPYIRALDRTIFDTKRLNLASVKPLEEYRKEGFQYLVLDSWHPGMVLNGAKDLPKYAKQLAAYSNLIKEVESSAELIKHFSPYRNGLYVPFDPEDVEFVSNELWVRERLGPEIRIYKL